MSKAARKSKAPKRPAGRSTVAALARARRALSECEARLRTFSAAIEQSPACIVVTDLDARIQYVNPQFVRLTGYSFKEAIGQNPHILKTEFTPPETHKDLWATLTAGRIWHGEFCNKKRNGDLYWESAAIAPIRNRRGKATGYVAVKEDITEQRRIEEELRFRSVILATQQETSLDGILVADGRGTILSCNRRFVEMWGIPADVAESRSEENYFQWMLGMVSEPVGFMKRVRYLREHVRETSRYTIPLKDGRTFDRYSAPMFGPGGKHYGRVWYFRDSSDIHRHQEMLEKLSSTDGLTGIPNRRQFDETLVREWRRATRNHMPISLLLCDIDFFKLYNDHYGHLSGDECLRQLAVVLAASTRRPADLAARYGGEEFVCLLPETDTPGALLAAEQLQKRVEKLNLPHARSSVAPRVTLSIGVATVVPQTDQHPSELIRHADEQMYKAKKNGRNQVSSA